LGNKIAFFKDSNDADKSLEENVIIENRFKGFEKM